ncbi:MAG: response regulator [Pelomonas sp.]|nr:response regulator [Roseateles sp.]
MTTLHRIALLGFSAFERSTLASYFRLAGTRNPRYEQVQMLPEADFIVADADHEPSVKLVTAVERMPETVFVGSASPAGAVSWLARPIDPMRVLRELDVLAARRMSQPSAARPGGRGVAAADAARRRTVIQPVRPARPEPAAELLRAAAPDAIDFPLPDFAAATAQPPPPLESPPMVLQRPRPLSISSIAAAAVAEVRPRVPSAPIAPTSPMAAVAAVAAVAPMAPVPPSPPTSVAPRGAPAPTLACAHLPPMVAAPAADAAPAQAVAPAAAARAAANVPAQAARVAAPRPVSPRGAGRPVPSTALLVDDSELALRFLEKKLAPYGLVTECVSHSDAAVQRLAERRYDFIFLDMELGERSALDGLGLCQRIKRAATDANVVMVTAHHTELDRVRGALAGCDGFLGKPLDEQELALYLARFGVRPAANAGCVPS